MQNRYEETSSMDTKAIVKLVKKVAIGLGIILLALILNPVSCVGKSERGIKLRLGAVQDGVLLPGVALKIPVIESIDTYSIVPNKEIISIPVGNEGAITTDNQTIGATFEVYWKYKDTRIAEIAREYTNARLTELISTNTKAAIKSTIGSYTIFDLASKQTIITSGVLNILKENTAKYPVEIVEVRNTNYTWSDDFDKAIKETQKMKQEVLQKEQEVSKATLEFSKQVAEADAKRKVTETQAEAKMNATIIEARGALESAKLNKQAKIEEGLGIKSFNESLAANLSTELKLRELSNELARIEKWDGKYVSVQNYTPIPIQQGSLLGK